MPGRVAAGCPAGGQEAEDGIVNFLRSQEIARHLDVSVRSARRTVDITYEQYRQGAADYIVVYVFQSDLTLRQDQLAAARGDIALSLISLYRALGGGWEMRLARGDGPCPATTMAVPTTVIEQVPPPTLGNSMAPPATSALTPPMPAAASNMSPPKIGPVVPMLP